MLGGFDRGIACGGRWRGWGGMVGLGGRGGMLGCFDPGLEY